VRLFRVIVPVPDIDAPTEFYESLTDSEGKRVSSGRHYLDCGGTPIRGIPQPTRSRSISQSRI
jgi:hypothetical protein